MPKKPKKNSGFVHLYEQYMCDAFKGDALLMTIARDQLVTDWHTKHLGIWKISKLVTNHNLTVIAKHCNINPPQYDTSPKRYANAYEARIWQIFIEDGYVAATAFFKKTIMDNFAILYVKGI